MFTVPFWRGAGERMVKTFFQAALATLLIQKATFLTGVDWFLVVNTAALAAVISLMTSVGNIDRVTDAATAVYGPRRAANGRFVKKTP